MSLKTMFQDFVDGAAQPFSGPSKSENLFLLNGRVPLKKAIPFGLQHVFAMFAANVTPLLLVFSSIGLLGTPLATQAMLGALFMAGFGTLIQLLLGARLPIVIGTSFTYVPIFMAIGSAAGGGEAAYYTIIASSMVGGIAVTVLSFLYRFWSPIIKPIVPGIVVLGIGLSLLSSGATNFFGGSEILSKMTTNSTPVPYYLYIIVALVTLLSAVFYSLFVKGVWKNLNIMFGIIVGYLVACCIPGMVDFSTMAITEAVGPHGYVGGPMFLDFTKLRFEFIPCVMTTLCYFASTVESIGDATSLAVMGCGRTPTNREVTGCLVADGINSTLGACFGSFPQTTYAENVGLVAQTKIINRFTILMGALFLVLISFFPPVANLVYTIPSCVIGGAMVILFGSIAVIGIKMVSEAGFTDKNILLLSITLCLGFGMSVSPAFLNGLTQIGLSYLSGMLSNCVIDMFVIAFVLSWVLPDSMHIALFHRKH